MCIITTICMRVHDNIRNTMIIPNDFFDRILKIGPGKTMDEYYDAYIEDVRNSGGTGYRAAPYTHCKNLVNECLLRMKAKKKVLVGKEEKTVVRLFGLESEDAFHRQKIALPQPAPAPSVNSLWLILNRPECYFFHVAGDLNDLFGWAGEKKRVITQEYFDRSLDYILEDEYRQERLPAMLII